MADMLRQTLEPAQKLQQKQQLVPQQLQSLQILLATTTELEQKIEQEMQENPTLELVENGPEEDAGDPLSAPETQTDIPDNNTSESSEQDEAIADLMRLSESWHDYTPPDYSATQRPTTEDDERRAHFFDSLVAEASFQETLMEQLRETDQIDEDQFQVGQEIIGNIDDNGYLRASPAEIAQSCNAPEAKVKAVLEIIQSFDPPGVGAQDLRECMLLQLKREGIQDGIVYKIVENHVNDLARNHIPAIAKALNVSRSEVYEAQERIRRLHPYPGALMTPEPSDYVVPDVYVHRDENGEFEISTNKDATPKLRLSNYYIKLLKSENVDKETKQYIRRKIADSKLLLRALNQRRSTLEEITERLLQHQRNFFENGICHQIKPLTLQQIADEIGVHETTVSRAIANKYVQTPHGLMPFKRFFASGIPSASGEKISDEKIKAKIHELVQSEDPSKPLSDSKLTEKLRQEGLNVARRTVAKYREQMGILSSNLRKSHRT